MSSMSEHPERDRVAADEQRIGALLRAVEAPAPAALQQRIAELAAGRRRRLPAVRGLRAPSLAFAGAFAAAIAAVVVLLTSGSTAPPTALRASQVALAAPTGPAPTSLIAVGTRIRFPRWSGRGWPTAGTRIARIGGRTVTVEYYRSYGSGRLGYAIVSGAPLRLGSSGWTTVARSGGEYRVARAGGAEIVVWVQDGHTCVLASQTASSETMLKLAVAQDRTSLA
jgi:hypothetical protein